MAGDDSTAQELLRRASEGDQGACQDLLQLHRKRLRRMVAVRLDQRLAARVDPSDVVQEALLEAAKKLPAYLRERPLPFYPWLRRLAWERLVKLHRRHLHSQKRVATREQPWDSRMSDESLALLANRLMGTGTSPSGRLVREELRQRVRAGLAQLSKTDREVLVMRYLEDLPTSDIASILAIGEGAVKMRHRRALSRLSRLLGDELNGGA